MAAKPSEFRAMAILRGVEEVPPVKTSASACFLMKSTPEGLAYQLETDNVPTVTALKLHLGIRSQTGIDIANLLEEPLTKKLHRGTITEDDLINNMEGLPLDSLISEIKWGHVYVNLYTEEHDDGLLRGQMELTQTAAAKTKPKAPSMPTPEMPAMSLPGQDDSDDSDSNFVGVDVSKIGVEDIFGKKRSSQQDSRGYGGGGGRSKGADLSSFMAEMNGGGGGLNDFMAGPPPGGMQQSGFMGGGSSFDDYLSGNAGRGGPPHRGGHARHRRGPPQHQGPPPGYQRGAPQGHRGPPPPGYERRGPGPNRAMRAPPSGHGRRKHRRH